MEVPSLLRSAEHKALGTITLSGTVLDIGGDAKSAYRSLFGGEHSFTTVNLDTKTTPDIFHDLEEPLPIGDSTYDHVLLINVLEHIYNYRQLLSESVRVLRPHGTVSIVVPFLYPIHPSPNDFWRYSKETLVRECSAVGLSVTQVTALGGGVFSVRYLLLERLLPFPCRFVGFYTLRPLAQVLDIVFTKIARALGKKYNPEEYALGFLVHATKQ